MLLLLIGVEFAIFIHFGDSFKNVIITFICNKSDRIAQSVARRTHNPVVPDSIPISPSAYSRRAVVSYWRKYVHEVLVNRLGGLRKSVVRLTDSPDMTIDVYRGRKTTTQVYM